MTPLRKRFIEDLQLHGLAPSTQEAYVTAIKGVAAHFHQSPDQLTEDQIREYFLHLTQERKISRSHATVTLCAVKFFYQHTLQRTWPVLTLARPRKEKKLPSVLSRQEVCQLLSAVEGMIYRSYFTTVYACGLRLQEAAQLQVSDVDAKRGLLHVRGKGAKDRFVPLPPAVLILLRECWKTHRSVPWLFPLPSSRLNAPRPVYGTAIRRALALARKRSGLTKPIKVHTLRHSYATHLLEAGVNQRLIQVALGHNSPRTTARYTHLTEAASRSFQEAVQHVMEVL